MSRKIAPFIDIVRLEDKETKLKAFIKTVLEQACERETSEGDQVVLLVARSIESPVAKAVASLVREGAIAVPLRTILALTPREDADAGMIETFNLLVGANGGANGKVIKDARLFDAHEQLVLGPAASWVGDCMRRDPMKCDAYECYAAACAKTAGWALTSHERLWAVSQDASEMVFVQRESQPVALPDDCVGITGAESDAGTDPMGNDPMGSQSS